MNQLHGEPREEKPLETDSGVQEPVGLQPNHQSLLKFALALHEPWFAKLGRANSPWVETVTSNSHRALKRSLRGHSLEGVELSRALAPQTTRPVCLKANKKGRDMFMEIIKRDQMVLCGEFPSAEGVFNKSLKQIGCKANCSGTVTWVY